MAFHGNGNFGDTAFIGNANIAVLAFSWQCQYRGSGKWWQCKGIFVVRFSFISVWYDLEACRELYFWNLWRVWLSIPLFFHSLNFGVKFNPVVNSWLLSVHPLLYYRVVLVMLKVLLVDFSGSVFFKFISGLAYQITQ